mgnify:CR=1 FL=1
MDRRILDEVEEGVYFLVDTYCSHKRYPSVLMFGLLFVSLGSTSRIIVHAAGAVSRGCFD